MNFRSEVCHALAEEGEYDPQLGTMRHRSDYEVMVSLLRRMATRLNTDGSHTLAAGASDLAFAIEVLTKKGKGIK